MMRRWIAGAALAALLVGAVACSSGDDPTPTPSPVPPAAAPPSTGMLQPSDSPRAPTGALDTSKDYTAVFEMEKGGEFTVRLFDDKAPLTVENFVNLSRIGYYDGVTFHRVLKDFMAQSGDPTGTGSGGPGYRFPNELDADLRHDKPGILSMANAGMQPGPGGFQASNGSQFFITFAAIGTGVLDGYDADGRLKDCTAPGTSCHTVFGEVIEGLDVAMSISLRDPGSATTPGDVIRTIRITES